MHKYKEETMSNHMITDINVAVAELPPPQNRCYVVGY
jgi:hypothetical protein